MSSRPFYASSKYSSNSDSDLFQPIRLKAEVFFTSLGKRSKTLMGIHEEFYNNK